MTNSHYALRFISGKYQGDEFPLRMEREVVVGRGSDVDMVLVEDMVSRKHARIVTHAGEVTIHDLESTNGTFVNGEKVQNASLKEGDRILIGTSILKLVSREGAEPAVSEADAKRRLEQTGMRRPTNQSMRMSGAIEEIPLPDLMQLLSTSRKSGVLVVHHAHHGDGRIYFRKGQIYYATIDDSFDIRPRKAIYRMLTWQNGTFLLDAPDETEVLEEIDDSTEAILMEGMRQLDELRRLESELPPADAALTLPSPLEAPLRDLGKAELDVLQLVLNHGRMQAVLDKSPESDLDVLEKLQKLIAKEYVAVAK